jgi:hypothetical protein
MNLREIGWEDVKWIHISEVHVQNLYSIGYLGYVTGEQVSSLVI